MKKSLLFFAGLLILLFTSCTEEDYGSEDQAGSQGKLTFNLSIPGSAINTYASVEATGGEDEVYTLYVLFFDPTTDKFIEMQDISPENGFYTSGQTVELDLPESSVIQKQKAYSLFFIANPDSYLDSYGRTFDDWVTLFTGKILNEIKQLRIGITGNEALADEGPYYNYRAYQQTALMMTGSMNKEAGQEMVTAELTRIVARFDVKNKAGDNYTLVSASIWNAFPVQTIGEINFSNFDLDRIKRLYGIRVEDNDITGGLYAYENYVAVPAQDDDKSTCLILGITNNVSGKTGYYRINANLSGRAQQLRRNNVYTFNILSVLGPGENNEDDAHSSTESQLEVQINEWDVDDEGTIVFDGDNILALGTKNVFFDKTGGDREYRIFTAGEGTLSISQQDLPSGITAELKDGTIYIHADPSETVKGGFIEFQFGNLKATMYITQRGEIEQYLTLSLSSLPMFDNIAGETSEDVTVTSSGPWTATIYNHVDAFVFATTNITQRTGDDQDIFNILTIANNENIEARYAFVHATLDENPKVSAVLILSQNGLGGILLNPELSDVVFDADGGYTTPETDYTFEVQTVDDAEWVATLYGTHKNYFTAESDPVTNTVTVKSNSINPLAEELSAELRVYLKDNPAIYTEVNITQYAHSLTVTPATVGTVPATGGSSDILTITSSTGWVATMTLNGYTAYFNGEAGKTTAEGVSGDQVFITFPELTQGGVQPEVVVTFTIPETNLTQTVIVRQSQMTGRIYNFQNSDTWYGYLVTNPADANINYRYNYVEQLYQSIVSPDWFGLEGTYFCGGASFLDVAHSPQTGTDIYVMNCFNGSRSDGNSVRTWLKASGNRVLLLLSDDRTNTTLSYLGLDTEGYTGTGGTGNNVVKTDFARTLNTDDTYTADNNKLYEYLLRTGPFTAAEGEISKEDIQLLPYDASNNCLTDWPSTMIPLMLDEHDKTRMIMGIDPTLRMIYVGEMDLFTTMGVSTISYTENGVTYTGANNYYGGPHSEANLKFLNNLIAWMYEVVEKGEEFTNQFK